jgi:hypothetical protein
MVAHTARHSAEVIGHLVGIHVLRGAILASASAADGGADCSCDHTVVVAPSYNVGGWVRLGVPNRLDPQRPKAVHLDLKSLAIRGAEEVHRRVGAGVAGQRPVVDGVWD